MRLAQIEGGIVVNVIEVDDAPDWAVGWPEAGPASIGWCYDGAQFSAPPALPPTPADITAERDRRLALPFTFAAKTYDCDRDSLARITGAATLAGFAMGAGAAAGNLRWHGGDSDFAWIAHDNSLTSMDAPTCFAFGQAAAANQSAHIFAAKTLKETDPLPDDYGDDRHWP